MKYIIVKINQKYLLGKAYEVLVICVHICELTVNQTEHMILTSRFFLADIGCNNSFSFFSESGISVHLFRNKKNPVQLGKNNYLLM